MTTPNEDPWLDARLREIAVPDDLVARLQDSVVWNDETLDSALRSVPQPPEMISRLQANLQQSILKEPGVWTDELIDLALRQAPLPDTLLAKCRQVTNEPEVADRVELGSKAELSDARLDERLRDVPLPKGFLYRLLHAGPWRPLEIQPADQRQAAWRQQSHRYFSRRTAGLAVAASLLLMLGFAGLLAVVGSMAPLAIQDPGVDDLPLASPADLPLIPGTPPEVTPANNVSSPTPLEIAETLKSLHIYPFPMANADSQPHSPRVVPPPDKLPDLIPDNLNSVPPKIDEPGLVLTKDNPQPPRILALPDRSSDILPELETVDVPRARGIELPLSPLLDRVFLLRYQTNPIVPLVADKAQLADKKLFDRQLLTSNVPVWLATETFDRARASIERRRLPAPGDVRVEDFLAATVRPGLAGLGDGLGAGLVDAGLAGGPSLFRSSAAKLVQVVVAAGNLPQSQPRAPLHLVVAIDASASMKQSGRLSDACDAVRKLIASMRGQDRLSVLVFRDDVEVLAEDIGLKSVPQLLERLSSLRASGGTGLVAGLQAGVAHSLRETISSTAQRHLVLLSDGSAPLPETVWRPVEGMLSLSSRVGTKLHIVDLSDGNSAQPVLERLSNAPRAELLRRRTDADWQWSLSETITSQSSLAAVDMSIQIKFNPRVVQAYRLMGHETNVGAGWIPTSKAGSLRFGQVCTGLWEIWLRPDASESESTDARMAQSMETVASVEISWHDPLTGDAKKLRRELRRDQLAESWEDTPPVLQMATLAAEAAEVLRESPFSSSRRTRDLRPVLFAARSVSGKLMEDTSYRHFYDLLSQWEDVRTRRGPAPAGGPPATIGLPPVGPPANRGSAVPGGGSAGSGGLPSKSAGKNISVPQGKFPGVPL